MANDDGARPAVIVKCSASFMEWMTSLRPAHKKYSVITAINDIAREAGDDRDQIQARIATARTHIGPSQRVELIEKIDGDHVSIFTKFVKTRRYKLLSSLTNSEFADWNFVPGNSDLAGILEFVNYRIHNGSEDDIVNAMDLITQDMIVACIAEKAGISEQDAHQAVNALQGGRNASVINLLRILRLP